MFTVEFVVGDDFSLLILVEVGLFASYLGYDFLLL
jgi:hypothetical protein